MKRIHLIIAVISIAQVAYSQSDKKLGGGYYGNTVTYPGIVLEYELEQMHGDKASLPLRIDVGFYKHPRYNTGVFVNVNYGFRRYYKSGLYLEESIGIGALSTFLNADGVYKVDESGNISEASRYIATDLMPTFTLGIGYNLSRNVETKKLIWVRPQVFWQYPHKTSSMFTPSLSVGYSVSLQK